MAKREFTMNGKSYNTLTAIAAELGVKRVYTRDFAKYGITEVTPVQDNATVAISKSVNILSDDAADDTQNDDTVQNDADNDVVDTQNDDAADDQADNTTDTAVTDNPLTTGGSAIIFAHATEDGIAVDTVIDIDHKAAEDTQNDDADDTQNDNAANTTDDQTDTQNDDTVQNDADNDVDDVADTSNIDEANTDTSADDTQTADTKPAPAKKLTEEELIAQIERDVVDYADATELSQNLRKVSLNGLIKMAENVQVDTWERIKNAGIRKMRVIMELKKAYFPTQSTRTNVSTGPSPWKKIPTADLQATATAKGCVWKDCSNEGILRMRLIMVLKAAGVTADEFKK